MYLRTKMNIPKNELAWVRYFDRSGKQRFLLTSSRSRELFYLYDISSGSLEKLGKDKSPTRLEERFHVNETLEEGK